MTLNQRKERKARRSIRSKDRPTDRPTDHPRARSLLTCFRVREGCRLPVGGAVADDGESEGARERGERTDADGRTDGSGKKKRAKRNVRRQDSLFVAERKRTRSYSGLADNRFIKLPASIYEREGCSSIAPVK